MTKSLLSYSIQLMLEIKSAEFKKGIRGTDDILTEPRAQVAFIGRSNVGKSSLMNYLLNRKDLVKAGKTPGKTREINFFLVNNAFYFVDLPGYGFATMSHDGRDQLGRMIEWYFKEKVFERKVVLVLDIKAGLTELDEVMIRILHEYEQDFIIVANKADKLNQKEKSAQLKKIGEKIPQYPIITSSATDKIGGDAIWAKIFE